MPAKNKIKAKAVAKKPTTKKSNAKKITAKPTAKKSVKKIEKKIKKVTTKTAKKIVSKSSVKKAEIKTLKQKKKDVKTVKKVSNNVAKKIHQKKPETKVSEKKISTKKSAVKKPTKLEKNPKLKNTKADIKTSAKIIAKAKKDNEIKIKPVQEEVQEKKNETQKNLIIVKKLGDLRTKVTFKTNDFAVYPSHGVGKIIDIEKTSALGQNFSCYLMYFEKEKLTIKIPVTSADKIGLRHLVSKPQMDEVFSILRSGIKKLKGMWSRRAQEYETKINSGDIMLLAEVLRDLTRDIEDGERSYSERIIYETAVNRLASEYAVIYGVEFEEAKEKVISTAKDKLGIDGKITQKDEFDEFDYDSEDSENEDEDENDEEEEEDDFDYNLGGGDDEDYDDDDDDKPKKRKGKK